MRRRGAAGGRAHGAIILQFPKGPRRALVSDLDCWVALFLPAWHVWVGLMGWVRVCWARRGVLLGQITLITAGRGPNA